MSFKRSSTLEASFAGLLMATFLLGAGSYEAEAQSKNTRVAARGNDTTASSGIRGTWLSADGGAKVKINPCGNGICGNIVWLREPIDRTTGRPKTDKHNANETQRQRPMLGLQVMSGMQPDGDKRWSGTIYNADDGKTYRSKLTLLAPDKAKVEGCVLVFCKGETWTKETWTKAD